MIYIYGQDPQEISESGPTSQLLDSDRKFDNDIKFINDRISLSIFLERHQNILNENNLSVLLEKISTLPNPAQLLYQVALNQINTDIVKNFPNDIVDKILKLDKNLNLEQLTILVGGNYLSQVIITNQEIITEILIDIILNKSSEKIANKYLNNISFIVTKLSLDNKEKIEKALLSKDFSINFLKYVTFIKYQISEEIAKLYLNKIVDEAILLIKMISWEPHLRQIYKLSEHTNVDLKPALKKLLESKIDIYEPMNFWDVFKNVMDKNDALILLRNIKQDITRQDILDIFYDITRHFNLKSSDTFDIFLNYIKNNINDYKIQKYLFNNEDIGLKEFQILFEALVGNQTNAFNLIRITNLFPKYNKLIKFILNTKLGKLDKEHYYFLARDKEEEKFQSTTFTDLAVKKNDWITILAIKELKHKWEGELLINAINLFLNVKNKTKQDFYQEYLKNNSQKLLLLESKGENYDTEAHYLNELLTHAAFRSKHAEDYMKYFDRFLNICAIYHNNNEIPIEALRNVFLNKSIDLTQDYVDQFLEIYSFLHKNEKQLKFIVNRAKSINPKLINDTLFNKALQAFEDVESTFREGFGKIPINKELLNLLKYLYTEINKIEQATALEEYYRIAKPKNHNLYKLDMSFNGFNFKVLQFMDPAAFSIGVETDCCQRIGGAAEEAAIDSFINPLASVLVLYKDNKIIAQSYFHYIPEDNGFILDNIEVNEKNIKNIKFDYALEKSLDLANLYIEYANNLKQKYPDIKYIKVGLGYTKINTEPFKILTESEDPRHFEVDDPYSDYQEEEHIDLLKPKKKLANYINKLFKITNNFNYLVSF